jgi:hypothetical protein
MPITYPTLRMDGKEYVLIPKAEFKQRWEQDLLDARKADRAAAKYRAGKLKTVSHSNLKKSLGF